MKQLIALFVILFGSFLGLWTYKLQEPVPRPDAYVEGIVSDAGNWVSDNDIESWTLDKTIPANYVPVAGKDEVYMVIDDDGNIINYRKRTLGTDGKTWLWEDIDTNIPEGWEVVPGLESVYKVSGENGDVTYYRYIRNSDNTFAFVEVDENGNEVNKNTDATKIDGKHVLISGNYYKVLNDSGVVIGIDKRIENPESDKTENNSVKYIWTPVSYPEFLKEANVVYVSSPHNGIDVDQIISDYLNGMAEAYQKGYGEGLTKNNNGNINNDSSKNSDGNTGSDINKDTDQVIQDTTPTYVNNSDGTHTESKTVRETKKEGSKLVTYETTVNTVYDSAGNIIKTYQDGPYVVSSQDTITKDDSTVQGDKDNRKSTLTEEITRVCKNYDYKDSLAKEVYALVNAQRASDGKSSLTYSSEAENIAKLRAADMAGYDTTNGNLPTYEKLGQMLSFYKISSTAPGENMWKSSIRTAEEINTRFQSIDTARETRMSDNAKNYGIAIVEKDGFYYICEVLL